ncbi:MAG: glycosyltransferase family 61 protein [Campylobacteraceae bacterium]|jgi:capsular polysaccharide biosynthesis protein|nr:glycosyltransferase family 61 protein [Campylobacteraceae bacterium]
MKRILQEEFYEKNIFNAIKLSRVDIPIVNLNNNYHNNCFDKNIFIIQTNDIKIYPDFFVETSDGMFVEDFGHREQIEKNIKENLKVPNIIDREIFLCGGHPNYCHWLLNWMPRLFLYEIAKLSCPVLMNKNLTAFHKDTLKTIFPNLKFEILSISKPTIFTKAYIPSFFLNPQHSPFAIQKIRSKVLFNTDYNFYDETFNKIYISRKNTIYGRILNEEELIDFLKSEGYTVVCLEKMSLLEQAKVFFSARNIVSPYGAGLANLIFISPKCTIVEIRNNCFTKIFWSLASMLDCAHYRIWEGTSIFVKDARFRDRQRNVSDIYVDLEKFKNENKEFL